MIFKILIGFAIQALWIFGKRERIWVEQTTTKTADNRRFNAEIQALVLPSAKAHLFGMVLLADGALYGLKKERVAEFIR